jgi:hypothetical protein
MYQLFVSTYESLSQNSENITKVLETEVNRQLKSASESSKQIVPCVNKCSSEISIRENEIDKSLKKHDIPLNDQPVDKRQKQSNENKNEDFNNDTPVNNEQISNDTPQFKNDSINNENFPLVNEVIYRSLPILPGNNYDSMASILRPIRKDEICEEASNLLIHLKSPFFEDVPVRNIKLMLMMKLQNPKTLTKIAKSIVKLTSDGNNREQITNKIKEIIANECYFSIFKKVPSNQAKNSKSTIVPITCWQVILALHVELCTKNEFEYLTYKHMILDTILDIKEEKPKSSLILIELTNFVKVLRDCYNPTMDSKQFKVQFSEFCTRLGDIYSVINKEELEPILK